VSSNERATAPAVARAGRILSYLAENPGAQRLTAIASAIGIAVSSTASICNALEDERLVVRRNGGYVLGPRNVELAQRFLAHLQPIAAFTDVVAEHAVLRGETVQMAMLDGSEMLYVARRDGDQPFLISSAVGKRLPANCTAVGKACLALLPPEERLLPSPLPALTDRSIVDLGVLEADLEQTLARGYAIDDEEASPAVVCLAVARQTPRRETYGISATLLKSRLTAELQESISADLIATADALFPAGLGEPASD
jgi:DNA-binding IclR family transcriptional regulator